MAVWSRVTLTCYHSFFNYYFCSFKYIYSSDYIISSLNELEDARGFITVRSGLGI